MSIHLFGIRHHGPGCARSLVLALDKLKPDIILIEGPPDAQKVIKFVDSKKMVPPVALLIYPPDAPYQAVYYPFTNFSPEWQALKYALGKEIPARFIDLPQSIRMAEDEDSSEEMLEEAVVAVEKLSPEEHLRENPLQILAQAAGYDDQELWWEHQVEQRKEASNLFKAIAEAMRALRAEIKIIEKPEQQREAHMRTCIRKAQKESFKKIAVVCGAWHVPALEDLDNAKEDKKILKDLKKKETQATWIPWTNSRLSSRSGYGAGISSPGWYDHIWMNPEKAPIYWVVRAAQLFRKEDLDASSASVIEAVRLADALAALRDLPMPGMKELNDSIQTVLCHGEKEPMQLIYEALEIDEKLGKVPSKTPMVPLQKDLEILQRKLRMEPSAEHKEIDLDLRKEKDRAKSQLLHRLQVFGINWGTNIEKGGKKGTFHEYWDLRWNVKFIVHLIEMNVWGNTIETAATAYVCQRARDAENLPELTELLERTMLAELPRATNELLTYIQNQSAVSSDVRSLMESLPPLAKVARYGDVRGTKTEQVSKVIDGLFERIIIGTPGACSSLDDEAAAQMHGCLSYVQESLKTLNREDLQEEWQKLLVRLTDTDSIHGLLRGWFSRLLLEKGVIDQKEFERRASLALSPVNPPNQSGAWVEGAFKGSGLMLLHQDGLWLAMDTWLSGLSNEAFVELLPLLRRAFAEFEQPQRRAMGEKVKSLGSAPKQKKKTLTQMANLDIARANKVLPVLANILGVKLDE